ncbi:MAG: InlB B-repeat-containing protein, partial [Fibromonadaceae bacterium]|nr:InlB B-repeat-containing protein [Fibromonadaceae bacterium]
SSVESQTINHGGTAVAPTAPTKAGHTFAGWHTDEDLTIAASFPVTNATDDAEFWAKWTLNSYTVTFKALEADEEALKTETVNHGSNATAPTAPTRAGYTFTGWSPAFTNVTSNLTVVAQWEEITSIFANRENPKIGAIGVQTYYDLKGTSLGTTKPTAPGVYLEKHGKHVRRIAVR